MDHLSEGVRLQGDKFIFDYHMDEPKDIVFLKYVNTKSIAKKSGIQVYYAWNFNKNANPEEIALFRKQLKKGEMISDQDKISMINKAVIGFDSKFDIGLFDIVIFPKSSSPLVRQIAQTIKAKSSNLLFADEVIVKNAIENIHIDYDTYLRSAKTPEEKLQRKKDLANDFNRAIKNGPFEIKKVHQFRKRMFSNYLTFKDDTSRQIYNILSGGNVLMVDDYLTTGSTLTEMIRLVSSCNPKELSCFFLIK